MDIQKFIDNRPAVYHLTAAQNLPLILKHKKIFSANRLIDMSADAENIPIKRQRRPEHTIITIGNDEYSIRDQRPISEKALQKCLTNGWVCADFYEHLNNRVFTWPTIDRLQRHYDRYQGENPVILILDTAKLFAVNPTPLFCRLNSGATRANSYLGGVPPSRGIDTFLPSNLYNLSVPSVAEVTFEHELILPDEILIATSPSGATTKIKV